jgi:hypothetical protein
MQQQQRRKEFISIFKIVECGFRQMATPPWLTLQAKKVKNKY